MTELKDVQLAGAILIWIIGLYILITHFTGALNSITVCHFLGTVKNLLVTL